ncbi:unnamed protein product [Timema podura]|uniref:Uncharacterized protein n=1 Tax=Timema podura TaxID=61482 RepID=A0ABN7NTK6_TIMPD|nr:unnamed protein product [Timema podura]
MQYFESTVSLDNATRMLSSASSIGLLITPIDTLEKCLIAPALYWPEAIGKQTPKISDGLVVIIEQQFDNEKLLLLRKAVSVEEKAPVVFLAGDEHNWPQQLKSELNISNEYTKRVYVVIKKKAPIDGRTLIQQLSKEPKADKLRAGPVRITERAPIPITTSILEDGGGVALFPTASETRGTAPLPPIGGKISAGSMGAVGVLVGTSSFTQPESERMELASSASI